MTHEYRGYRILVRRTPELEASILTPGAGFSLGRSVRASEVEGVDVLLRRAYAVIDEDIVTVIESGKRANPPEPDTDD
ncbi:MAG: hypothetical protein ACI8U3_002812 [Brevundimonas sp.]|jgi:hypothetical protein